MPSFELGIVLDIGGPSPLLKRFDMVTGTYFGSFGAGYLSTGAQSLVMDQSTNSVFVLTNVGPIQRFNYNTGEYLGEFSPPYSSTGCLGHANKALLAPLNGNLSVVGATDYFGRLLGVYAGNSGDIFYSGCLAGNGKVYSLSGNSPRRLKWWNEGAYGTTPLGESDVPDLAPGLPWQMAVNGSNIVFTDRGQNMFNTFVDTSGPVLVQEKVNLGAYLSASYGTAFGHNSLVFIAGQSGSTGQIVRYNTTTRQFRGAFGSSNLTFPVALQVVTAPEPGSLIGIGIALSALFLRRRRA